MNSKTKKVQRISTKVVVLALTIFLSTTASAMAGVVKAPYSLLGSRYVTGREPKATAISDFNRDGNLDFVTANSGGILSQSF